MQLQRISAEKLHNGIHRGRISWYVVRVAVLLVCGSSLTKRNRQTYEKHIGARLGSKQCRKLSETCLQHSARERTPALAGEQKRTPRGSAVWDPSFSQNEVTEWR
jgi:hypothetical protein